MTVELRDNDLFVDGISQDLSDKTENPEGKYYWGIGHKKLIEDFYRAVRENTESPIGIGEAEKSLRILLAAYRSQGKNICLSEDLQ